MESDWAFSCSSLPARVDGIAIPLGPRFEETESEADNYVSAAAWRGHFVKTLQELGSVPEFELGVTKQMHKSHNWARNVGAQ